MNTFIKNCYHEYIPNVNLITDLEYNDIVKATWAINAMFKILDKINYPSYLYRTVSGCRRACWNNYETDVIFEINEQNKEMYLRIYSTLNCSYVAATDSCDIIIDKLASLGHGKIK